MTETCCGNNIGGGEEELLQQDAHHNNHNSWLHIQLAVKYVECWNIQKSCVKVHLTNSGRL
jgi:hypothetical protein